MLVFRVAVVAAACSVLVSGCGKKEPQPVPQRPQGIPEVLTDTLQVKKLQKTYVITGIGLGESNRVAIINERVVTPGQQIDPGVVLTEVESTYAVIVYENTETLLRPASIQDKLNDKKASGE